jgi:hypothetical protein
MSGRPRLVAVATIAVLACLPTAARADFLGTGNDWSKLCNNSDDVSYGLCAGYVWGVADIMMESIPAFGWRACLPKTVNSKQAVDVVKRWLDQHPERGHYNAVSLVAVALAEAFPCKP